MLNQHVFTVDMQVIGRSYRDVLTPPTPTPPSLALLVSLLPLPRSPASYLF